MAHSIFSSLIARTRFAVATVGAVATLSATAVAGDVTSVDGDSLQIELSLVSVVDSAACAAPQAPETIFSQDTSCVVKRRRRRRATSVELRRYQANKAQPSLSACSEALTSW